MIHVILSGIVFGLVLAILPGPVFFGLIHTSLNRGFKFGFFFALGVALSDISMILLTYFGISNFLENALFKKIVEIIGGMFMCILGLYYFFKPVETTVPFAEVQKEKHMAGFIFKGFLLNIVNPSIWFSWIGFVSLISVQYGNNKLHTFTFFCASVCTVLSMDTMKSYISNRIKVYFTNNVLNKMNKAVGIVLFGVGIGLLYSAFAGKSLF
jgi:threonine/homoserine/homoserine lactone efflux protein